MTKYNKLKQIIREANPEIMKLKSGCRVKDKTGEWMLIGKQGSGSYLLWNTIGVNTDRDLLTFENLGRPIRLDDTALVVKDKHYLIDNWKVGTLDDQDPKLIKWILNNLITRFSDSKY